MNNTKEQEEIQQSVSLAEKILVHNSESKKEKKIELVRLSIDELNSKFENPRKIKKKNSEELQQSLEKYGDFGVIVIDENNSVISGNQRVSELKKMGVKEVDCKRLIGYTDTEKKAINIKANTHAGDWDLGMLANWTADMGIEIIPEKSSVEERTINEMELVRFERYDYVIIACRSEMEFNLLCEKLDITSKYVKLNNSRKIKARAVWFDKVQEKFK